MPDEEHGNARGLGEVLELGCALFELRDGTGGRIQQTALHRLDGVGDDDMRVQVLHVFEDFLCAGFCQYEAVGGFLIGKAGGAHLELRFALLAGDIEDSGTLYAQGHLQKQCGFSDAGFAAQKDDGTGHDAAAEYAVEFAEGRLDAGQL